MPTPVTLDPADARPLTNREISKVLCSIIGGVVTAYPELRPRVTQVLQRAKSHPPAAEITMSPPWEIALLATVSGFRGWCKPHDVDTALEWVDQNLPIILGNLAKRLPS